MKTEKQIILELRQELKVVRRDLKCYKTAFANNRQFKDENQLNDLFLVWSVAKMFEAKKGKK